MSLHPRFGVMPQADPNIIRFWISSNGVPGTAHLRDIPLLLIKTHLHFEQHPEDRAVHDDTCCLCFFISGLRRLFILKIG